MGKADLKNKFKDGGKCVCDLCGKTARMGGVLEPMSSNPKIVCYDCMMKISAEQQGISVAAAKKRREMMFGAHRLFLNMKMEEYLSAAGKSEFDDIDKANYIAGYLINVWNSFSKEDKNRLEVLTEKARQTDYRKVKMNFSYLIKEKAAKIGRNDACPCGSGKKYKKCCLLHDEMEEDVIAGWKSADSAVIKKGMTLNENSGLDIKLLIEYFWGEKRLDLAREKGVDEVDEYEFNEWLMNDYYSNNGDIPFILGRLLEDRTLTGNEMSVVEARIRAPKSVWMVTFIQKGKGALLRNIFDRNEVFTPDKMFSLSAKEGCLVAARVFTAGSYNLLSGAYRIYPSSDSEDIRDIICKEQKKRKNAEAVNVFLRRNGHIFGRLDSRLRKKEGN